MKQRLVIGILAHVDAGKTTLSEAILFLTGNIRSLGRVDNRNAFLDTYELERARGITIFSKQAVFEWGDKQFTLLDTPGHVDFSAEMERTLQVLDYAVLVISGADGVQGHTETLWRLLERYHVPVFLFVNKMDQTGTDRDTLFSGANPSGQQLLYPCPGRIPLHYASTQSPTYTSYWIHAPEESTLRPLPSGTMALTSISPFS